MFFQNAISVATLAAVASTAFATPISQEGPVVEPGQFRIQIDTTVDPGNDAMSWLNGQYLVRPKGGNLYNKVSADKDGEIFTAGEDRRTFRTSDDFYITLTTPNSDDAATAPAEFIESDEGYVVIDGEYIKGTGKSFGGWQICSRQYGPYLNWVLKTPPANEPGQFPCGIVALKVAPAP